MEAKYKEIDEALGKSDGPFLSGKEPCAQCIKLAPQLYHIGIATDRIKVGSAFPSMNGCSIPPSMKGCALSSLVSAFFKRSDQALHI